MAIGQSRAWADVWVDDLDERLKLQSKALFFIPSARQLAIDFNQNAAGLASIANVHNKDRSRPPLAGIAVIRSVLGCKQPVTYESAVRFINLLNPQLPPDRRLGTSDILACVFRLRDTEIVAELGTSAEEIAAACKLSPLVVKSALKRLRITYVDAYEIWAHLSSLAKMRSESDSLPLTISSVLNGDERSFIVTDASDNYTLAIEKVGSSLPRHSKKASASADANAEYVYNRNNLRFAPRSGHHWAIELVQHN